MTAHAVAAALGLRAARRAATPLLASVPAGWRNVATMPQQVMFEHGAERVEVTYRVDRDGLTAAVNGAPVEDLELLAANTDEVELRVGGVRYRFAIHVTNDRVHVDSPLGATTFTVVERFPVPVPQIPPGSLRAPLPGTVVRVLHAVGDHVTAGATLIVLEAMKMEHPIRPPADGVVTSVAVAVGDQVETGAVLATVTADDLEDVAAADQ